MPSDDNGLAVFLATYFLVIAVITIAAIVFNVLVYWRICSKAGFNGAMSLLIFIPFGIGAIIMMCILAFGEWPALRDRGAPMVQFNQVQGYPQAQPPYPQAQSPYPQPSGPYSQPGQPNPNYPNYPNYQ